MLTVTGRNVCILMGYFCWKYITFEPKKHRGVKCHNIEEVEIAKFEKKLTCALKSDMTNFMVLKGNVIFEEKLTGGLKNDMQNLINFYDEKIFDNCLGWSSFYS